MLAVDTHGLGLALTRLRASAVERPLATDALLTLAVYLVLTLGVTSEAEAHVAGGALLGALLNVALVGPLLLRRRSPIAVLAVIAGAAAIVALAFGPTGGEAAALVALGTVASREDDVRRVALGVIAVVVALVAVALVLDADDLLGRLAAGVAAVAAAAAIGTAARARRGQMTALADRAARLERERAQDAQLAVAAERARIARELHDVVAHNVSVMVALADGAQHTLDADPRRAADAMGQVAAVGREALAELRGLLGVLRDADSDSGSGDARRDPQPGIDALDELVERVRAAGVKARLRAIGEPTAISPLAQMTIYRIVQEALTNVLRHGKGATAADVTLRWMPDAVELEIADDGARSPAEGPRPDEGRGVTGMRERASVHGASLTAGPRPHRGWRVATRIPLSARSGERRP
jgi:signal transduction histidine kinase